MGERARSAGRWARLGCALAVCSGMLAGCDLAPAYHVPVTAVPLRFKEEAAWRPGAPADQIDRGAWWATFGDPVLDGLEAQVDEANPTLASAYAAFQRERAFAAEAVAGLYPTLSVGGQITTNRQSNRRPTRRPGQPNQYMNNEISAQATYEVDLWDRVANAIKAGKAAAQASAADLESVRLSLHAELADDYVTLRGLDAQAHVLTDAEHAYQQALDLTQARFAGAISSQIDVTRARVQLDNASAALTDVNARRALVEHAIAAIIGKLPSELTIPPSRWTIGFPDISPGLPSTLLERRPDVASAERIMAAANATIGVARAAFYPALSLNLLYGLQDSGFNLFQIPNSLWALGPGLALPIFEGGLLNAEEAAAVGAYQVAVGNYRATVLAAFQEVEDALSQIRLLAVEAQQQDAGVVAAQQTLTIATNLYKDGATNFLDVVVAQTQELQAEQNAADIRTRRAEANVDLIRALGGGWDQKDLPDMKDLSVASATP